MAPKTFSFGISHTLAADESNNIYAFGANNEFQIGDSTTEEREQFKMVFAPPQSTVVSHLAAGPHQSFAVTHAQNGSQVVAWGMVEEKADLPVSHVTFPTSFPALQQYARGAETTECACEFYFLTLIQTLINLEIVKIVPKASYEHNVLLRSGEVLQFGASLNPTQMGAGSTPLAVVLQHLIARGEKIVDIAGGWGHVLALTSAGRVLSWGSNMHGQVGQGGPTGKYAAYAANPAFFSTASHPSWLPSDLTHDVAQEHSIYLMALR